VYLDEQRENELEEAWEKTLENEDIADKMQVDGEGDKEGENAPVVLLRSPSSSIVIIA